MARRCSASGRRRLGAYAGIRHSAGGSGIEKWLNRISHWMMMVFVVLPMAIWCHDLKGGLSWRRLSFIAAKSSAKPLTSSG
jgi:preprotein translocase subunit SecG